MMCLTGRSACTYNKRDIYNPRPTHSNPSCRSRSRPVGRYSSLQHSLPSREN